MLLFWRPLFVKISQLEGRDSEGRKKRYRRASHTVPGGETWRKTALTEVPPQAIDYRSYFWGAEQAKTNTTNTFLHNCTSSEERILSATKTSYIHCINVHKGLEDGLRKRFDQIKTKIPHSSESKISAPAKQRKTAPAHPKKNRKRLELTRFADSLSHQMHWLRSCASG